MINKNSRDPENLKDVKTVSKSNTSRSAALEEGDETPIECRSAEKFTYMENDHTEKNMENSNNRLVMEERQGRFNYTVY